MDSTVLEVRRKDLANLFEELKTVDEEDAMGFINNYKLKSAA